MNIEKKKCTEKCDVEKKVVAGNCDDYYIRMCKYVVEDTNKNLLLVHCSFEARRNLLHIFFVLNQRLDINIFSASIRRNISLF